MKGDFGMDMKSFIFSELPIHDTCWSITTGRDGKIYVAVCGEMTGGLGVFLVSVNTETDRIEYLVDVAEALNEPPDNGHATHSKIHYCLLPADDGTLYGATHCTGPPLGHRIWRPWNCWDDSIHMFTGFHIFHYDPKSGKFEDFGIQTPNEGSRAMALAEKRKRLYGVTYPRDHFYVYELDTDTYRDLGRIGDVNPQAVWLDREENAYTADDLGYIVKYDADSDRLLHLDVQIPHAPFRDGTHNTVYDVVPSPDGKSVYGVTWSYDSRLFRYDPCDGPEGKMHDLGRAYGPEIVDWKVFDFANHTGGLVFGSDGYLYFASYVCWKEPKGMYLIRMDTKTLKREEIGPLVADGYHTQYISKATKDYASNLFFASCINRPTRIYEYTPDYVKEGHPRRSWPIVRKWG